MGAHNWVWGPAPVGQSRICSKCGKVAPTWTPGSEEVFTGPTECPITT